MASPTGSAAALSEMEAPSSPVRADKSFMTNVTEDDDTKMMDATPDPSEKPSAKGKGRGGRESVGQGGASTIGKIRHLKKEDGEPLWRKDIQYDFLRAVFDNSQKVFTNSYEPDNPNIGRQCFADLYIDTMSRSSKTSKVLRDKLLSDRDAAKGMAMVCLLVNIGRMNTTLNFFPEMRAQLRTYHAIPSLQAHQDPHAYKQLQDAPRLKSILKGGAEDRQEPNSLDNIKFADLPRTNPVNLLFVICQAAAKIAELHFPPNREFHDLIMKTNYTSESRARAFLWIMWFYLESDFTEEGCEENPFGAGVDYGVDVANQGVPRLDEMTPEEEEQENVDPKEEIDFGLAKKEMRAKIIQADQAYMDTSTKRGSRASRVFVAPDEGGSAGGILPRIRPSKHESDIDSSRSTPPPRSLPRHSSAFGGGGGGGTSSRRGAAPLRLHFEASSPGGHGGGGGGGGESIPTRKPRPPTAHQLAVERNRTQRVEYILDRGLRKAHHKSRKNRRTHGAIVRAYRRIQAMADPFDDSEGEESANANRQQYTAPSGGSGGQQHHVNGANGAKFREHGLGGLCLLADEQDDFGEEFSTYTAAFRRSCRRLERWAGKTGLGVVAPVKMARANGVGGGGGDDGGGDFKDPNETEEEPDMDVTDMMDISHIETTPSAPRRRGGRGGKANGRRAPSAAAAAARAAKAAATKAAAKAAKAAAATTASTSASTPAGDGGAAQEDANGDVDMDADDAEDLDEVDKSLIGMADGGENDEDDDEEKEAEDGEDLDDVDRTLLGMGDGESDSE